MHYHTISELSVAFRSRTVSPVAVVEHMLARIEALDPRLGAYVTVTAERARRQAVVAEREIAGGYWRGPLHGVPLAYKDIFFSDFAPTTAGTLIHRDFRPTYSATALQRLEKAGAVTLGKLKTTEQAFAAHHPAVNAPSNPWHAAHWSGSSSSGSGVSTAAGLAFGTLGSDTGGSIRFPSAANGLTGLKPTWGRVSRHGVFELAASLDHIGPMARSALDCAIMLGAMAGADSADPTALHDPVEDYAMAAVGSLAGLRIGLPRAYATAGVDPEIVQVWEEAAVTLAEAGAILEDIAFPEWREASSNWETLCSAETALAHAATYPSRAVDYGPVLAGLIESGRKHSAMDLAGATQVRLAFSNQLRGVFAGVDLVLIPATIWPTPTIEEWGTLASSDMTDFIRFTGPFDMTGSPTLTFPAGFDKRGMPLALQLVGPHLAEAAILKAGSAYQRATDWHLRHPEL